MTRAGPLSARPASMWPLVGRPFVGRLSGVLAAMLLGLGASACGGGGAGQEAARPAQPAAEPAPEPEEQLIPPEEIEAVARFLDRKSNVITRCFTDALEAGELPPKTQEAYVTVTMTVAPGGEAQDLVFSDATVSSEAVEGCIREHLEGWALPEVSQPFEYSHRYGFRAL